MAGTAITALLVGVVRIHLIVVQIGSVHQPIVPNKPFRIAKGRPIGQEQELIDIADQGSLAVHEGIAWPTGSFVVHAGPIEHIVAQKIVLDNDGDCRLGLE